jgi:hypothetical protein
LLCVPCGFVVYGKPRGILKIARFFKGLLLWPVRIIFQRLDVSKRLLSYSLAIYNE